MTEYTRGRDTSRELSQVRTILSRSETALEHLGWLRLKQTAGNEWDQRHYGEPDPEAVEMFYALQEVVRLLDRWRRTGRAKTQ